MKSYPPLKEYTPRKLRYMPKMMVWKGNLCSIRRHFAQMNMSMPCQSYVRLYHAVLEAFSSVTFPDVRAMRLKEEPLFQVTRIRDRKLVDFDPFARHPGERYFD